MKLTIKIWNSPRHKNMPRWGTQISISLDQLPQAFDWLWQPFQDGLSIRQTSKSFCSFHECLEDCTIFDILSKTEKRKETTIKVRHNYITVIIIALLFTSVSSSSSPRRRRVACMTWWNIGGGFVYLLISVIVFLSRSRMFLCASCLVRESNKYSASLHSGWRYRCNFWERIISSRLAISTGSLSRHDFSKSLKYQSSP